MFDNNLKNFLKKLGTQKFLHVKNGTLYDHLVRVGKTLESWGLDKDVVKAGMCHTLYSSEAFKEIILSIDKRDDLKSEIGGYAEKLVYTFGEIDRSTLKYNEDKDNYSFLSYIDKHEIILSKEEAVDMLHIILANQFDHIHAGNTGYHLSILGRYLKWKELFCEKARISIEKYGLCDEAIPNKNTDYVRFIAHAGVQLKTLGKSILIDPWIYPSNFTYPIIEGFNPGEKTIDFIVPEPRNNIGDLTADIILLSHLHTHHSPLQEIRELAIRKPIILIMPEIDQNKINTIKNKLGDFVFHRINFKFLKQDEVIIIDGVIIKAMTHTRNMHFSYFVKTANTSVLHIVDSHANEDMNRLDFSKIFDKFNDLQPDFLFIGAASHNMKIIKEDGVERDIKENTSFSPVQAAKFVAKVMPKNTATIGVYNASIWDGRLEGVLSVGDVEGLFFWSVNHLAPSIKVHALKPGDLFECKDGKTYKI